MALGGEKQKLSESVEVYSKITDEKLRELYSKADIFVLPSWVEGYQLPPLEAMACNTAVVATRVGGVPEYEGEVLSVDSRDSEDIIAAVESLIENEQKRKNLKEKGKKFVNNYSWEEATQNFEETLKEITE
jgi:glycosyltransferase involved in cell wall biosynthesis